MCLSDVLHVRAACSRCGAHPELLAHDGERFLCADCWREAGSPWPGPGTIKEQHEAVVAIEQRMLARGGADAYRVKAGKS